LEGSDGEDHGSKPAHVQKGKTFMRPNLNGKKLDVAACACHPIDKGVKHKLGGS
jgi:hypothetical protein